MNKLITFLGDALALGGAGLITYGAHQIHEPLGHIVAGVFLLLLGAPGRSVK